MFLIEIPYCDFDKIFRSDQAYRWKKVNDGKYIIIDGKKILLAEQKKNRKVFLCSEDDFFDYWYNYFDCNYDYEHALFDVKKFYKEIKKDSFFFSFIVKENRRYRMVKNDLFETMIYYALDEKNRDQKFERFLHIFGEKKNNSLNGLKITWYKFPNPDKIDLSYMQELTGSEIRALSNILNIINDEILEALKMNSDESEVYDKLQQINDDKEWIKSVMLYSLGFKSMFCINNELKSLFRMNNIKSTSFLKFDNIKGFLLEIMKVK